MKLKQKLTPFQCLCFTTVVMSIAYSLLFGFDVFNVITSIVMGGLMGAGAALVKRSDYKSDRKYLKKELISLLTPMLFCVVTYLILDYFDLLVHVALFTAFTVFLFGLVSAFVIIGCKFVKLFKRSKDIVQIEKPE